MSEIKVILSDSRQKRNHHKAKEEYFRSQGIKVDTCRLYVGDYAIPNNQSVCVDTKANISEIYSNVIQQHERFRNEAIRAQEAGIKLIVLIENKDGIKSVNDLDKWRNPQMYRFWKDKKASERKGVPFTRKPPASNVQLKKILWTLNKKYGVEFQFCTPQESGKRILEILSNGG